MSAQIINGKNISAALRQDIARQVSSLPEKPGLAVILVGDNPASHIYVSSKIKACAEVGIVSYEHALPASATETDIRHVIQNLNVNPKIHGILLQLPLPDHLAGVQESLVQTIAPHKDVDGLTITNAGKLFLGMKDGMIPCTPQGSLRLIKSVRENLSGLKAVVIGRSNLFGKPMAQLLLGEHCTVTTAHSKTSDLSALCRSADILVCAIGKPRMVKSEWVKPGAIVIDVGINRLETGKICGDVDFDSVQQVAGYITPVPGGVGPMTIACLLLNTLNAASA
jgi:methylenetetrahydrofolate dehydrogenase (NADP+)/methenyltetrahydrofolate cyclohydrolase